MPVPNTFANATTSIPLSQLDANFATAITLGNTAIQLGNTVTTLNNMTLANVTVNSGNLTTSTVTVGAGSNTAPSITFSGDTNTGIYSPAADTIAFTEGGVEAMRIDSSGNVGIGTSSPGARLDVAGFVRFGNYGGTFQGLTLLNGDNSASAETISYLDAQNNLGTPDTNVFFGHQTDGGAYIALATTPAGSRSSDRRQERMRIDASGNVGIGQSYGLTNTRLMVAGQSAGANGAYATGVGSIVLNETGRTSVNDTGGLEFKASVFGAGYGAKIIGFDNGTLAFANRENSATFTERARITSGGVLCVGTTNVLPGYLNSATGVALQGDGTSSFSKSGNITTVINNNGSGQSLTQYFYQGTYVGQVILNGTTGVLYQTASDYRLKQNVRPLTGGLATIAALKPSTYQWKADNSYGEGFLAHELAAHIPQAVVGEKDALNDDGSIKPQSVDYSKIVVHLVAAMQELKAENDDLKARVAALENK